MPDDTSDVLQGGHRLSAAVPLIEPRAVEILESIKAIFATKGFERASMQDLARAAGMSAGNFYRYFPSKNAIIEAMIQRDLDEVERDFTAILDSPRPLEHLREKVRERIEQPTPCEGPIWAEIEAAAGRRPEIALLLRRMETQISVYMVAVFARIAGVPLPEADRRFSAHARLIVLLVKGMSMQSATQNPGPDHDLAGLVMQIIERSLSDIAGAVPCDTLKILEPAPPRASLSF